MSIIIRPKDPRYSSSLLKVELYDAVPPCEGRNIDTIFGKTIDFATLVEKFEEVKELLIKDEKFRKAVKAWAEANMIDSVMYDKDEDCIYLCGLDKTDLSVRISFDDVDVFEALEHKRLYSIDELCGEEE